MKKILLLLFIIPTICFSQGNDPETILRNREADKEAKERKADSLNNISFPRDNDGNISYTAVVKIDEALSQDLYSRGKLFVADAFKSNKDVTQLNDDASKVILIKPIIKHVSTGFLTSGLETFTNYQLKIECKDGKYRYTIDGLALSFLAKNGMNGPYGFAFKSLPAIYSKKMWFQVQSHVDSEIKLTISLLQKQMTTKIADF